MLSELRFSAQHSQLLIVGAESSVGPETSVGNFANLSLTATALFITN